MKFYWSLFFYKQHYRYLDRINIFQVFRLIKKDVPVWHTSAYCHTKGKWCLSNTVELVEKLRQTSDIRLINSNSQQVQGKEKN